MSEYYQTGFTDRPDGWQMDYSKMKNVTSFDGKLLTPENDAAKNYGKLWDKFKANFSQGVEYSNKIGLQSQPINTDKVEQYWEQELKCL